MVNAWWKSVHLQAGFVQWDSTLQPNVYGMHLYIWCVDPMLSYEVYLSVLYLSIQAFGNLMECSQDSLLSHKRYHCAIVVRH